MRGVVLYAAVAAPFLGLATWLAILGVPPDTGLSVALLVAIIVAIFATFYVRSVYVTTSEPRSVFFGMLVSALEFKVAFGAWVGYLIAASLLAKVGIILPLPSQPIRAVITGVAALVLLISAIYYAATIYLERREVLP
jgi:hypothetical protein